MLSSFSNSSLIAVSNENQTNHEDIIFAEPRSLLSILEEYHPDSYAFNKLKNLVKPNNTSIMVFKSLKCFGAKDAYIVKIEYYDKIYLESWNLNPMYLNYIEDITNEKHQEKCDQNKKSWYAKHKKSDPWDNMHYDKSKKRKDFQNIIKEGLDDVEDINEINEQLHVHQPTSQSIMRGN